MIVQVNIPTVRKNLEHFCTLLKENGTQRASQYICYVNRKTGDFYFQSIENKQTKLDPHEWKPVKLQARPHEEGVFEIVEEGKSATTQFHYGEFTPLAHKVMEQMVRILNAISSSVPSPNLTRILEAISNIEIDFSPSASEDESLLQSAFFHVDRLGAEDILKEHVPGTYIFRKDAYAALLEGYLPIQCYTLTYLCPRNKVNDLTLVYKEGRWSIYNGDLTFSAPSYPSLFSLLESLGNKLCTPVIRS